MFCGRVFIFLFQSFPLGDKSSVNLRGEYHVENITTFDGPPVKPENPVQDMEVDQEGQAAPVAEVSRSEASIPLDPPSASSTDLDPAVKAAKNVTFDADGATQEPLDMDTLYPTFWTLQQDFSNPTRLFEAARFESFKYGLESTFAKFKKVQSDVDTRSTIKAPEDRRGTKRKRGERGEDLASNFNPKYLTSRDLFELEVRQPLRCF